ncbi:MAG: ABC transporter substrate-binding protein [Lachnospiraceae bacterium]|nr:ABC transporter substrate-binding protein [Lachnospiraceae bacterium]
MMKKAVAVSLSLAMVLGGISVSAEESSSATDTMSSTLTAMEANGFIDSLVIGDYDNIDTSRKSTYNTDERLDQLTVYIGNEITSWTPWQAGQGREGIITIVFEPLFYYHDGYEMEACLAKDWYEEDDTHFVVEIYDYIYDTDGNNLTAQDVVESFDYFVASGNASDFDYYESSEAIDDYTVRFTWKEPIDSITALATMMETSVYTQQAFNDHDFTTDPVGTGAYYLQSMQTGAEYIMAVNEDYWQTDEELRAEESLQNVEILDYKVISDSSMAYISFQSDEIYNYTIASDNIDDFKEGGVYYDQYTVVYEKGSGRMGFSYNQAGDSIMNDVNMRLAVSYAIDGDSIVAAIGSDSYISVYGEGGAGVDGYNSEWDTLENYYTVYDPDLAKEYLAQTDYNGEELVLIAQSGNDADALCCQVVQQMLAQVGINVTIEFYDHAIVDTYLYNLDYWDMWFFSWNGDPISQQWGRQFDMNNYSHGANEAGINDETLQEMIEEVQTSSGYSQELIDEIQEYITENCMSYSMYGQVTYTAYGKSLARLTTFHGHKSYAWGACEFYLD